MNLIEDRYRKQFKKNFPHTYICMHACVVFRKNKMSNKLLLKATPLITAALLLTILAAPVFATGAHLWFYSVEPPIPLPNPETWDPNYIGDDPIDSWITESVVIPQGDWDTPFSLWIGNADPQDTSYDTTLVISVNDVAYAAIVDITVEGNSVLPWNTDEGDFPLPPHGVSNSAEWAGFAEALLGDIPSGGKMEINIDITLGTDLEGAKIHFDAYGWSTDEHTGKPDITSPFSHDATFVVPEAATIVAVASSLVALGTYAYKRKKQ